MKKNKRILFVVGILAFVVLGVLAYFKYQTYKEKEQIEQANIRAERIAKKDFMVYLGRYVGRGSSTTDYVQKYISSDYNDKYWEAFLDDNDVIRRIDLINQFMYEKYPDSPYISLTIEALKSNQLAELADFWYFDLYNYFEDNEEISFLDAKDLAIRGGREKDIINMLGYTELTVQYDYTTTYEEVFLKEENLGEFIEQFNLYIEQNYPDITYNKITVEALAEEEHDTYLELWDLTDELKKQGVELSEIVAQIHQGMDAANP